MRYAPRVFVVLASAAVVAFACKAFAQQNQSTISLSGQWQFRLDPKDVGIQEKWFEADLPERINLPGATDEKGYVGAAWYSCEIDLPELWEGGRIALFLERCHWTTQVWVDGKSVGEQDGLSAPHVYDLGTKLLPGKHRLTIRVDNRHKIDGGNANGIVGRIELRATDRVWIEDFQVFPDAAAKTLKVRAVVGNVSGRPQRGRIVWMVEAPDQPTRMLLGTRFELTEQNGETTVEAEMDLGDDTLLWDEAAPNLYTASALLAAYDDFQSSIDKRTATFGMRNIEANGGRIAVNGRPTTLHSTLQSREFPQSGNPPMDIDAWQDIMREAKSRGWNHIRFPGWCPPEAAFMAADREGLYLQVEVPCPATFGEDPAADTFVRAECERIFRAYGNHPSFCVFSLGSKPNGEKQKELIAKLLADWQKSDPRRLYIAASDELPPSHSVKPELYAEGFEFAEGPALDDAGNLYVVNYQGNGKIGRIASDGTAAVYCDLRKLAPQPRNGRQAQANGLKVDAQGRLIAADAGGGRVLRLTDNGANPPKIEVLADAYENQPLNAPNDVALDAGGNVYFSDPGNSNAERPTGSIYRINASDNKLARLDSGLAYPNGLAVTPDGKHLCLAESARYRLLIYDLSPDGKATNRRVLIDFPRETVGDIVGGKHEPDGMIFDAAGRLYVAMWTGGVINVVEAPSGRLLRQYDAGGSQATNCHFHAGRLYVTVAAKKAVFRLNLGVDGFDYRRWAVMPAEVR